MKEFYFDQSARIQTWIEAENKEDAIVEFEDQIRGAGERGLQIDVESYEPSSEKEINK